MDTIFRKHSEGILHLSRKPEGIGVEYKDVADALTGIMLFIEIQEGKKATEKKKYCNTYPKSVARLNDEGDDDDDSCAVDHQIMSIKSYLKMRKQASKKSPVGIAIKEDVQTRQIPSYMLNMGQLSGVKFAQNLLPMLISAVLNAQMNWRGRFSVFVDQNLEEIHQKKMWMCISASDM